jgi:hypothetical protein
VIASASGAAGILLALWWVGGPVDPPDPSLVQENQSLAQQNQSLRRQVAARVDPEAHRRLQAENRNLKQSRAQILAALAEATRPADPAEGVVLVTSGDGTLVAGRPAPRSFQVAWNSSRLGPSPGLARLTGIHAFDPALPATRGSGDDPRPIGVVAPVHTVVLEQSPELSWQALPDAATDASIRYKATVYRVEGGAPQERPVAESGLLSEPRWRVSTRLPRGASYMWQVVAFRGDEEIGSSNPDYGPLFQVLGAEALRAREQRLEADRLPPLLRGWYDWEAGLRREAEAAFAAAVQQAAPNSRERRVAQEWLARARAANPAT